MTIAMRIVIFVGILAIVMVTQQNPPKIAGKIPSQFWQGLMLLSFSLVVMSFGWGLDKLVPNILDQVENEPVAQPVFLALWTGVVSLGGGTLIKGRLKYLILPEKQVAVILPIILNVCLHALNQKDYLLALAFFGVSGVLTLGLQERLQYAPIPDFLKGWPIQLLSLFLIFLSLSFFRGVFYEQIF